jgi:hypothetical protein
VRLLPIALLLCCTVGKGDGVVVGALSIPDCHHDRAMDDSNFDLDADFYAGQPLFHDQDRTSAPDALFIRIQHGGTYAEVADALSIQVIDLAMVHQDAVEEVTLGGNVRAHLRMGLRCPDAFEDLVAAADDGTACPNVGREDRDRLFAGDFNDPAAFDDPFFSGDPADSAAPHPSCIMFRRIGTAFDDEITAAFHFNILDGRTLDGGKGSGASDAHGYLRGRFRFTLDRGPGAQAFP